MMGRFRPFTLAALTLLGIAAFGSAASGATATFTPVGPTQVEIGTSIAFQISVSVSTLSGFNTADVIIGANGVTDIAFTYSSAWLAAFSSVTTPQYDVGFYDQSVFAGGNHSTSVGTSKLFGTVTVNTSTMQPGTYRLDIDQALDGFSTLGLNGQSDPLFGFVSFSVTGPDPTGFSKTRFISFSPVFCPSPPCGDSALRVRLVSLHHVVPPYTGGTSIAFTAFETHPGVYVGPRARLV